MDSEQTGPNSPIDSEATALYDRFVAEFGSDPRRRIQEIVAELPAAGYLALDSLKSWLDSFRPIPAEVAAELMQLYTVRLTYHSNAIEGNMLTQSETEMVLSHGVTVGGKSLAEHLEVIGHRDAMVYMEELAGDPGLIGEWEIRGLHSLIMRPVNDATSQTDAGRYRNLDVRASGTEHVYPPHFRVPELMTKLAEWLNSDVAKALHPVGIAAEAHYRLAAIHPFRDGNGRTSRLLMNLLLLRTGYPIVVLRNEQRGKYIDALVYAYGGDIGPLLGMISKACRASFLDYLSVLSTAGGNQGYGAEFYRGVLLRD